MVVAKSTLSMREATMSSTGRDRVIVLAAAPFVAFDGPANHLLSFYLVEAF